MHMYDNRKKHIMVIGIPLVTPCMHFVNLLLQILSVPLND